MKKIVFIDSSKTVLMNIENYLKDFVSSDIIKIRFYENPEHFIEYAQKDSRFDIIFTAINMAEMNGIEMIKKVKEVNNLTNVKIIALTTENNLEIQKFAKQNGFYGWLTKPFSMNKLTSVISNLIKEEM